MTYEFFRCATEGCGSIATPKVIKKNGCCKVCGGRRFKYAYWHGWNLPKPTEWIYVLLGLR